MRSGRRLGPFLVAWLMWLVIAAGVLQEGARLSIGFYLHNLLGGWPQVKVRLLRLKVASARGEGEWRGLRVAWEGAEAHLSGRLSLDKVVIGPAFAPILSAKDVKLAGIWSLPTGRIAALEISPFNPEWHRLSSPEKAGGDWILNLPLNIDVATVAVVTPTGSWKGKAALWGKEKGRTGNWFLALNDGRGIDVALQGVWDPRGGRGDGRLSSSDGTEAVADLRWTAQGFTMGADLWRGSERWMADATGERGGHTSILVNRRGPSGTGRAVAIRLATEMVNGEPRTVVEELIGTIILPDLPISPDFRLTDLALTTESSRTSRRRRLGASCVMVEARGKALTPVGELALSGEFQLLDPTLPSRLLVVSLEGRRAGAAEPELSLDFRTRQDARGATRIRGSATGFGSGVSFSATGLKGEWRAGGRAQGPLGEASLDLDWGRKGWSVRGGGTLNENASLFAFPTPRGPLRGEFSAEGTSSGIKRAEIGAEGEGNWSATLKDGELRLEVSRGRIAARGFEASGLDLDAEASAALLSGGEGKWRASLSARAFTLEGKEFRSLEGKGSGSRRAGEADLKVRIPFLDGEAQSRVSFGAGGGSEIKIEKGSLSLLNKDLFLEGLEGRVALPDLLNGAWKCSKVRVFGEEMGSLAGGLKWDPSEGHALLFGQGKHWGGSLSAEVGFGGQAPPRLSVRAKGVEADKVLPFVDRWVKLPLSASGGRVGGTVSIDLETPEEGLEVALDLQDVTIALNDGEHTLRKISGPLHGGLSKGSFKVEDSKWTLEGGQVPVIVAIDASSAKTAISFSTPEVPLAQIQNALFDFLPEYLGYGTMQGEASVAGTFTEEGGAADLTGTMEMRGATFLSEDKTLKVKNATGSLPLHLSVGEAPQAVVGFSSLEGAEVGGAFEAMGSKGKGRPLEIERIRYSVFTLDDVAVRSWLDGGNERFRITGSSLWGGELRGEIGLALSTTNPRYAGQAVFKNLSLKAFCEQSGTLRDFISGTLHGSLTFGGEGLGLSKLRMLAALEVGTDSPEERIIARKFLVKMGGERIKSLLHSDRLPYDEASAKCGLDNGTLTFYQFKLFHEANPVKAVLRKDVSFEVRLPARNSVSIWQLINHIKALEKASEAPAPPP